MRLVYDANGNLTDDDLQRKYIFDAWNNVVRVNKQNDDPISYYWYNIKGQWIAWQDDADADTTIDADEKYHIVLDMYGRTAATIRHEDTYNPGGGAVHAFKELFLYHNPGLGGASYTDNILVRLRDNSNTWTGAADGTLEEEIYYHANSRGEMVALTDSSGRLVEQVRYTPEGRPFNLPAGDAESDGDLDATDASLITTGGYEVRKDADLDGDADVDDVYYAGGIYGGAVTTGDGVLSYDGIGNRRAAGGRDRDSASGELEFKDTNLSDADAVQLIVGHRFGKNTLFFDDGCSLFDEQYRFPSDVPYGFEPTSCSERAGDIHQCYECCADVFTPDHEFNWNCQFICQIKFSDTYPFIDDTCNKEAALEIINCMQSDPATLRAMSRYNVDCEGRRGLHLEIVCPDAHNIPVGGVYDCFNNKIMIYPPITCSNLAHELLHAADDCRDEGGCNLQGESGCKYFMFTEARVNAHITCCGDGIDWVKCMTERRDQYLKLARDAFDCNDGTLLQAWDEYAQGLSEPEACGKIPPFIRNK